MKSLSCTLYTQVPTRRHSRKISASALRLLWFAQFLELCERSPFSSSLRDQLQSRTSYFPSNRASAVGRSHTSHSTRIPRRSCTESPEAGCWPFARPRIICLPRGGDNWKDGKLIPWRTPMSTYFHGGAVWRSLFEGIRDSTPKVRDVHPWLPPALIDSEDVQDRAAVRRRRAWKGVLRCRCC